ncbi:hypothetical protein AJ79_00700 [Helicocarpus griseus UAMH5409]|uniref:Uncharacterized protein n=1 Tax=Helicocarpus griseus UAMH5409 TaxID=1447875 RepID=A0A2B7YAK8_9EURO|nr:hypothetical protein AJ79_00700 [Helicocarpus griseus UAMH5409]
MPPSSAEVQNDASSPTFPRSASYNHLPALHSKESQSDVKRTLSDTNLPLSVDKQAKLDKESFTTGKEVLRQSSLRLSKGRSGGKVPVPTSSPNGVPTTSSTSRPTSEDFLTIQRPSKARSVSSTIATFARKPWKSSRSPSPSPPKDAKKKVSKSNPDPCSNAYGNGIPENSSPATPAGHFSQPSVTVDKSERSNVLIKGNRRSGNFGTKTKNESPQAPQRRASLQSLRAKVSLERLSGAAPAPSEDIPPVPRKRAGQLPQLKVDPPRKKDDLWSVFRGLDADYHKFHSKNSSLKANVIRSSLLPFISGYANHPSNQSLRPEDLDRRISILNKWWTGLLEVLNGRNSQSLSGVDRPVFLEAIVGIMTRPEWRIPTLPISSPTTPTNNNASSVSRSNTSLESTGTDFLVESIHHNIRNIFAQNLLSQIAYCVDKLSMRQTPASLVTFSGKTCAYAFFFCPGIADILVRLWNTIPDTLRRILGAFDVDRSARARAGTSEYILSYFPASLRSLSFTSHAGIVRCLRRRASPPLGAIKVNWSGPWISRWSGRDTDLFFVFVKQFHVLVAGFLPRECERSKYVFVPGLVSVHAQILTVLEHTLNKQSAPQSADNTLTTAASTTFDDFIDGADASASAIPLGTANSLRVMSENRLILLLRDIVTDRSLSLTTKQSFIENFCAILKVATKKISLFDHNACFVLFDFVEELVSVIPPYCETTRQPDLLDWDFWLEVCKKMMESNNSLTEVRVFAFIYTTWDVINRVDERKEALCLAMLLDERYFYKYFNHWGPMVRAYFQRLLCWRLARYEGKPSPLDTRIYNTLLDRLGCIWKYFLLCQSKAERDVQPPLSTAPCSPAPGRRILIIRNDYHPSSSMFVCLDHIIPPSSNQPSAESLTEVEPNHTSAQSPGPPNKKRWKSLKTIFTGPANAKPGEVTPPNSGSEDSEFAAADSGETRDNRPDDENQQPATKPLPKYTFRFSIQWNDRARFPSKDRRLFPPSLPLPAQLFLQSLRMRDSKQQSDSEASESVPNSVSATSSDDGSDSGSGDMNSVSKTTTATTTTPSLTDPTNPVSKPVCTSLNSSESPGGENQQRLVASKYAGRALAEWAIVVCECDNFFSRRRDEGVPSDDAVEIPILGVETFRK